MLIIIWGDIGTGKTLFMTLMAMMEQEKPIYANYHLDCPNYRPLTPSAIERLSGSALVLMDEGYVWLESRISSSLSNRFWSHMVFQSRKRDLKIIVTCQMLSTIDVRYRTMADLYILAEKHPEGFAYTFYKPESNLSQSGVRKVARILIPFSLAEQIYPHYDTFERVSAIDKFLVASVESDPAELNRIINDLAERFKSTIGESEITKYKVEDFCVAEGYPTKYAKMIYNRIKSGE